VKPVAFTIAPAASLTEASTILAADRAASAIAGGQSLMPMLNLRLARPAMLVPLAPITALHGADSDDSHITIGAAMTHGMIADGACPDLPGNILAGIAEGIAYRAVRNRGTIGGSLCHADPAADWLCTLTALNAEMLTFHPNGGRIIPITEWSIGAFRTVLKPGEILRAVRVPRPSAAARWAYRKACRKPGEFAHAMVAVLDDPVRGSMRVVIGALGRQPLLMECSTINLAHLDRLLRDAGLDPVARHMQTTILRRAVEDLRA
jgi:carbon-monoxide dehydrogenase medium subunit